MIKIIESLKIEKVVSSEQLKNACFAAHKKHIEDIDKLDYQKILDNGYVFHVAPKDHPGMITVLIPLDKAVKGEIHFGKDDIKTFYFHPFLKEKKSLLDIFQVVLIDGNYYHIKSTNIVVPKDDSSFSLKEKCFRDYNGHYYKSDRDLVEVEHVGLVHKSDIVTTSDTKKVEVASHCYRYTSNGVVTYYKHRELAPDYISRRPFFFNEAVVKPSSKRRLGVELEFSDGRVMSKNVFLDSELRSNWVCVRDGSIPETGAEFYSVPLEPEEVLDQLIKLYKIGEDSNFKVDNTCGFHFHVSASDFTYTDIANLVVLSKNIEVDLFKNLPKSRHDNGKAKFLDEIFDGFRTGDKEIKALTKFYGSAERAKDRPNERTKYFAQRYYWLNLDRFYHKLHKPSEQTLEFRCFDATTEVERTLAYTMLSYSIIEFVKANTTEVIAKTTLNDVINSSAYSTLIKKYFI